jgi:hypothetical protein
MPKKRKPYIAIELEVFDDVPAMAQDLGVPEDRFGWQLMKLWRRCWQQRVAVVARKVIEGFLPGGVDVLEAFGYAEVQPDGQIRLRGLERYFRIKAAQAAAAQETNKRNAQRALTAPDSDEGTDPGAEGGAVSAPVGGPPIVGKIEDRRSKIDQSDLPLTVPTGSKTKTKAPRKASRWEAIFATLQELRGERLRELGMPDEPEALPAALVNSLLPKIDDQLRELAGEAYDSAEVDVPLVFACYLEKNDWARGLAPAYPMQAFASPLQLGKARKAYEEQVAESFAASQERRA